MLVSIATKIQTYLKSEKNSIHVGYLIDKLYKDTQYTKNKITLAIKILYEEEYGWLQAKKNDNLILKKPFDKVKHLQLKVKYTTKEIRVMIKRIQKKVNNNNNQFINN